MRDLILHSLEMRKMQTASVVLSVAISVMALFALCLVYGGVQAGVQANAARSGAQMVVVPREAAGEMTDQDLLFTGAPAPYYLDASAAEAIASIDGVSRTSAQFYGQTLGGSCCSIGTATRLVGVDFTADWTVGPLAHVDLSGGLASDQVVVGSGAPGTVGATMSILGGQYKVVDRLEPSGSDLDQCILMDIGAARSAVRQAEGLAYLWEKWGDPSGLVSCVLVDCEEGAAVDRIVNRIQASGDLRVIRRSDVVAQSQGQLEAVFAILLGAGLLMLLSALAQLFARFYSCVWERKAELALYRALGADRRQLRRIIGGEVAAIVAMGVAAGLVMGALLYDALLAMLRNGSSFPFIDLGIGADAVVAALLAALFAVIALLAVAVPLGQLKRLEPSLAMQQGDID